MWHYAPYSFDSKSLGVVFLNVLCVLFENHFNPDTTAGTNSEYAMGTEWQRSAGTRLGISSATTPCQQWVWRPHHRTGVSNPLRPRLFWPRPLWPRPKSTSFSHFAVYHVVYHSPVNPLHQSSLFIGLVISIPPCNFTLVSCEFPVFFHCTPSGVHWSALHRVCWCSSVLLCHHASSLVAQCVLSEIISPEWYSVPTFWF